MIDKKDISFLIIGLGSVGTRHLRNLAALGIKRIYLYSESYRNLSQEELNKYICLSSLDDAIAKKPTAAIIASPTAFHMETALRLAEAGCHLFIEKPISHTLEGIESLRKQVELHQLHVQVGFQFRFHPALRQIQKWLNHGFIGRLVSVHVHWGEYLPSWHPWEDYRKSYSGREDLGGGVVLTLCHPFDYLRWLVGDPKSVYALTGRLSTLEIDTEDTALIAMQFTSGAIGSVYLDYVENPQEHTLKLIGEKGVIHWDNINSSATLSLGKQLTQRFSPPAGFQRNSMFTEEISHFIDCIQHQKQPLCTLEDGIQALQIALAVKESSAAKKEISFLAETVC